MIFEIIKHTPVWVFILFVGLLYLGYSQTKNRKVQMQKLFVLPISMILLSIFGTISAFGINKISLISWFVSTILSLIIGLKLSYPKNINYDKSKKVFNISGSWIPMILILIIFLLNILLELLLLKN